MKSAEFAWPRMVRIIHWALAGAIVLNLFMLEEGDDPHMWVGYAAVALVSLRIIYGFRTKSRAAFVHFPLRFSELLGFVRGQFSGEADTYFRHNPLASWVYLALWALVLALGVSGFMMGLDAFWGEEWLEETHRVFSLLLQGLILAHFAGLFLDSVRHKRKTWMRMICAPKNN